MGMAAGGSTPVDGPPPNDGRGGNTPSEPPGGGGRSGGGDDGDNARRKQELDWAVGEEKVRMSDGSLLSFAKTGYKGYVSLVHHPDHGVGHVTGHVDGSQHRHDYMADKSNERPIRSNEPYSPIFNVIGKKNPLG